MKSTFYSLLVLCISYSKTLRREEGVICSSLLHGYDVGILKLYRRRRLSQILLRSLRMRMTSNPCNEYEKITTSYLLNVNYIDTDDVMKTFNGPKIWTRYVKEIGINSHKVSG